MTTRLFAGLLLGAALGGCTRHDFPQSTVHPASDFARDIQKLLDQQVFWVVVIFVLVQALLVIAVMKFRSRPGAPDPKPVHGNTAMEIAWTVAPALVLALVAVPTVLTIYRTQGKAPEGAIQVRAIGHQWWWEFQYPDLGVTTASEMHLPVGRAVDVSIETADVLHSFWIPAMGGKRDAIPSHKNRMWFTPDSLGTFLGQCAELCGTSHANMRMKLMVLPADEFDAWVAEQKRPPAEPESLSLAWQGKQIYSQQACIGCHTIDGVSAGVLGPSLTHVGSRTSIAGSIYPNDAEHLGRWISDAPRMKPGSLMPGMLESGLSAEQVPAIVAYLQSLR